MDRSEWHFQAKGDEQLAVLPMNGGESRIVDDYIRHTTAALRGYNAQRVRSARMRLRAAVHHGLVEIADNGLAGRAVVVTTRLLESEPLHRALEVAEESDLVLALSDDVYQTTVAGGHTTLDAEAFRPVTVRKKELSDVAWLWVPGYNAHRLDLGTHTGGPESGAGEHTDGEAREHTGSSGVNESASAPGRPESGRSGSREMSGGTGSGQRDNNAAFAFQDNITAEQVSINNFPNATDLRHSNFGFGGSRG